MLLVNVSWRSTYMNPKIFCVSSSRNNAILRIDETLSALNIPHQMRFLDSYDETHSYWQRKLVKFLYKHRSAQFYRQEVSWMVTDIKRYMPMTVAINSNLLLVLMCKEMMLRKRLIFFLLEYFLKVELIAKIYKFRDYF